MVKNENHSPPLTGRIVFSCSITCPEMELGQTGLVASVFAAELPHRPWLYNSANYVNVFLHLLNGFRNMIYSRGLGED